jgi:hypothetical protein
MYVRENARHNPSVQNTSSLFDMVLLLITMISTLISID